jgi:Bacterial capsule synthesis protein PGA_cap
MRDTLAALDAAGIAHAGAGMTSEEAWRPAVLQCRGVRVLAYSFTDHGCCQEDAEGRVGGGANTHT